MQFFPHPCLQTLWNVSADPLVQNSWCDVMRMWWSFDFEWPRFRSGTRSFNNSAKASCGDRNNEFCFILWSGSIFTMLIQPVFYYPIPLGLIGELVVFSNTEDPFLCLFALLTRTGNKVETPVASSSDSEFLLYVDLTSPFWIYLSSQKVYLLHWISEKNPTFTCRMF